MTFPTFSIILTLLFNLATLVLLWTYRRNLSNCLQSPRKQSEKLYPELHPTENGLIPPGLRYVNCQYEYLFRNDLQENFISLGTYDRCDLYAIKGCNNWIIYIRRSNEETDLDCIVYRKDDASLCFIDNLTREVNLRLNMHLDKQESK